MYRAPHIYLLILNVLFALVSLLVFLSGGNRRLIRKKLAIGTLILSLAVPALSPVSCRQGLRAEKTDVWKSGWADEDTYLQTAEAAPKPGLTNEVQKKESAKRAAVLTAQHTILEYFKRASIPDGCCYAIMGSEPDYVREKLLGGVVKGGDVVRLEYGTELSCKILYRVKSKGLKKLVLGGR